MGDSGSRGRVATRQATTHITQQELRERGAQATSQLRDVLGLSGNPSDITILSTALAEIAAEEGRRNAGFATAVRRRYDEIVSLRGSLTKRNSAAKAQENLEPLKPIRRFERPLSINPFGPVNARYLSQLYGYDKLPRALQPYTRDRLKATAAVIESEHPGTKPTNRGTKDALIAYIVAHTPDDGLANIPGSYLLI